MALLDEIAATIKAVADKAGPSVVGVNRHGTGFVVGEDKGVINAGRNIPGVDVCTAKAITVSKLAPGGVPGRITLWSESALKKIDSEVQKLSLRW
jgi:ribosomal protein L4